MAKRKNDKVDDSRLVKMIYDEVVQVRTESFDLISDQRIDANYSFANLQTTTTQPMTNMSGIKFYFTPSVCQTLVMHQSKIFCSGKKTIEFSSPAYDPQKNAMSDQLSKMVNHVLHRENPGFDVITEIFRSAAVNKNGIAKTTWNEKMESFEETFSDISSEELNQIVFNYQEQGYEVDVVESTITQESVSETTIDEFSGIETELEVQNEFGDFTLKMSKMAGSIDITVLPPEEFMINEDTTHIHNDALTRFVGHKREVYRSDVQEMLDMWGVTDIDVNSLADYESLDEDYERRARHDVDGTLESFQESEVQTGPVSKVVVVESWIRADRDGDGFAEWIHAFTVGSNLLYSEEWYGPLPFTSYTFFPIPHKFYGLSVYDRLVSYEEAATGLVRSELDNARINNTPRWIVREGVFDTAELQSGAPGPIEVANSFSVDDFIPIPGTSFASQTQNILQDLRSQVVAEIGIDPVTGQISADVEKSGNDAAKTSMVIDNASVKMEGYARRFAEGPLRDISWQIAYELVRNKDSDMVARIVNEVTPNEPFYAGEMNFSSTVRKADLMAKVGLGHQTAQQKIAASQTTSAMIQQLSADPSRAMYSLTKDTLEGFGYEQPEDVLGTLEEWQQKAAEMKQLQAAQIQQGQQQMQMQQQQFQQQFQLDQQQAMFDMKLKQAETMAKIGEIEAKTGKIDAEARQQLAETDTFLKQKEITTQFIVRT